MPKVETARHGWRRRRISSVTRIEKKCNILTCSVRSVSWHSIVAMTFSSTTWLISGFVRTTRAALSLHNLLRAQPAVVAVLAHSSAHFGGLAGRRSPWFVALSLTFGGGA